MMAWSGGYSRNEELLDATAPPFPPPSHWQRNHVGESGAFSRGEGLSPSNISFINKPS